MSTPFRQPAHALTRYDEADCCATDTHDVVYDIRDGLYGIHEPEYSRPAAGTLVAATGCMESRAKLLGHPVHQMLVAFPIGAFGFSVTSDVLHTFLRRREFERTAARALEFALVSAAAAVPFGLIDWLAIPRGTRARRVGRWHALGNAALVGLLTTSRVLRSRDHGLPTAKWLSGAGLMLAGVTAWLGGELVDRHGIGVHDAHGLDASSSLRSLGSPMSQHAGSTLSRKPEPLPR